MMLLELIRRSKQFQGQGLPDFHARHFDQNGNIIRRPRRDESKFRMAEDHTTLKKIYKHGDVKRFAVA